MVVVQGLVGLSAWGADKPSAVQVCVALPAGVALFAATPQPGYRPLGDGTQLLDIDVTLNGQVVTTLTRAGPECLRAWVPAMPIVAVGVDARRPALNLGAATQSVNLKLKPDLWYDAGRLTVPRLPWATVTSALPGSLTLTRRSPDGDRRVTDFAQVPSGAYVVTYEPPPESGPCPVTVRGVGTGTIREDNRPGQFAELVDAYRVGYAPDVLAAKKYTCTPGETVEVSVRIVDGVYFAPRSPSITKVRVPDAQPRYVVTVDGVRSRFEPGQSMAIGEGQQLLFAVEPRGDVAQAP
ncbi:MAG: hypothetical protein JNG84_14725 [Archangium sp.]|nr:hypothetical protein [Archangium sp.]